MTPDKSHAVRQKSCASHLYCSFALILANHTCRHIIMSSSSGPIEPKSSALAVDDFRIFYFDEELSYHRCKTRKIDAAPVYRIRTPRHGSGIALETCQELRK
jgi:hypothetical protein